MWWYLGEVESARRERMRAKDLELKMPRNEVVKKFRAADLERFLTEAITWRKKC